MERIHFWLIEGMHNQKFRTKLTIQSLESS